jgi:hypothetical protein
LEPIVSAYPDVRFIMTHRDPGKSVPSYASMVSSIFPDSQGERDLERVGREVSHHLRVGMENAMAARARIGEDRFLDVHHQELVSDPLGAIRRIYKFLRLELRPTVEQAILNWHKANRSGSHGTHRYTAEEFGLQAAQIRSDFDSYIKHFGVEVED